MALRGVLEVPPTFPCAAPAHAVGRWLRNAAEHARRVLPDEVWPRMSMGTPSPGDLATPAPDLKVCLWWLNRLHEVFILGQRTEELDDAVICTLADLAATPPIRKGSKFRPKTGPDEIDRDSGKPEPTIVLDLGRGTMRVGLSALLKRTIVSGQILLAFAEGWRGQGLPAAAATGGEAMNGPSTRVRSDELHRLALAFRNLRDRLLRVSEQMQDSKEGVERLHRLGAQGGRLLAAAIAAGAGHPFDQWATGPLLEPERPGGPPSETNEALWWMQWYSFSHSVGPRAQPLLPGNFGRTKWQILSENKAEGLAMFTMSQPVSDPAHVWRDRIEDHAALCGLVGDELDDRAGRAEAAAKEVEELLKVVLDELEELLDDNRVRRGYCRLVEEAVQSRRLWIEQQCILQLREVVETSKRLPAANSGTQPPGSILLAMMSPGSGQPLTPDQADLSRAWKNHDTARAEAEGRYDSWAREHAAEPPLCGAFLLRWHRSTRTTVGFLPELSREYAAAFDPERLAVALAPQLLASLRKELAATRRPVASKSKIDGWTKQELCTQGQIGQTTFDRICDKAGVPRAESGQHGYRYGEKELERLIAASATPGKRRWPGAGKLWRDYLDASRKLE